MASYDSLRAHKKQIRFALVWKKDMTMVLNDDWLMAVVMYTLNIYDDERNLQTDGCF